MRILIVEDDYLQYEWLVSEIKIEFRNCIVDVIQTEFEFREKLDWIESNPPNIILMDIMLRWTDPSPNMVLPPPEIIKASFYDAGFRCQELLSQRENTKRIPIIFYSVLDKDDLEKKLKEVKTKFIHMKKDSDTSFLFSQMWKLIKAK